MKRGNIVCFCFARSPNGQWQTPDLGIYPKIWAGMDGDLYRVIFMGLSLTIIRDHTGQ